MNIEDLSVESPRPSSIAAPASFQVIRRLHQSTTHASVYVCRRLQEARSEVVVVKVLRSNCGNSAKGMAHEYDVATRLLNEHVVHPHVIEFLSVASSTSLPGANINKSRIKEQSVVLVMEYCSGGDLFSRLDQLIKGRLPEVDALRLFRQVVSGVRHLHTLGIAHRDISLENVLLDAHGVAKICDFGLSILVNSHTKCTATDRVGKVQYMAPEIVAGRAYDPFRADVWSLGVMLFIMLTGSPLFKLATPTDAGWIALKRVGIAGILQNWKMDTLVSSNTVALLSDMLVTDPSQRLQTLDHVLADTAYPAL